MYAIVIASVLCFVVVNSVPVKDDRLRRSNLELTNQEEDLKRLADKSFKSTVSVAHSSSHMKNVEVVNGKERVLEENKDKVFDPMTGELMRRLEQTLEGHRQQQGEPLKMNTHTQLDIPSQDIHKSWNYQTEEQEDNESTEEEKANQSQQTDEEDNQSDEGSETNDDSEPSTESEEEKRADEQEPSDSEVEWLSRYAPRQVAEYLVNTGDVETFVDALRDLVQSGMVTTLQAQSYESDVADAYDQILDEQTQQQYAEVPEEPAVEQVEPESPEVYLQLLRNALSRLYKEAAVNGNKDSEQTLLEFIDYMSAMVSSGRLPQNEVDDIIGLLGDVVDEGRAPPSMQEEAEPIRKQPEEPTSIQQKQEEQPQNDSDE